MNQGLSPEAYSTCPALLVALVIVVFGISLLPKGPSDNSEKSVALRGINTNLQNALWGMVILFMVLFVMAVINSAIPLDLSH